jgi:biotin transporter BioY
VVTFAAVAAYTVVHVVAFIIAGWVFAFIAEQVQRRPSFVLLAVMTVIVLEAVAVVNLAYGAQWGGLSVWSVIVANILAVAVMSWYVWQTHPTLRSRLATTPPAQVRV